MKTNRIENMSTEQLQVKIRDLANYEPKSEADWVERVQAEEPEVISGAIFKWQDGGLTSTTKANRRESASAILQAKLTDKITATMIRLDNSAKFLSWVGILLAIIGAAYSIVQLFGNST